ncbi:MAG: hypothetical protein K2R98_28720 [Gemmataceae bacterium]|nr:hypothetical protein [Gemmataceae bacterium]
MSRINRREFVSRTLQAGALAGLGDLAFMKGLAPVSAAETHVKFTPEVEPLVRLIEESPRDKLLESVAGRIRAGVSYQQLLTAVMLAGVRGIKPRPVGFKFHAVLVINSAHLASIAAPDTDRWLPLFWAMDNFKSAQAKNKEESGGWMMAPPAAESKLPAGHQAKQKFIDAMDNWDEDAADAAITAWTRVGSATEVIEGFWRFGARDFRDIGHKAIYVANAWRTLQTVGWRHAEPILRSLAFALLDHEGDNPAKRDAEPDRPGRDNARKALKIRADWREGAADCNAAPEILAMMRKASPAEASDMVVERLASKLAPASIWDGLFLTAGELLMRQPGIVGLHTVTSINALHYGFQTTANDESRRFLLLQAAAFLPMFRDFMLKRGKVRDDLKLDALEKAELKSSGPDAIAEIFTDVSTDRLLAARKVLALVETKNFDPETLMTAARRLIFLKGVDSHDYKFSSAALEDYFHAGACSRDLFLATTMFNLRGAGDKDNGLAKRTRDALGA